MKKLVFSPCVLLVGMASHAQQAVTTNSPQTNSIPVFTTGPNIEKSALSQIGQQVIAANPSTGSGIVIDLGLEAIAGALGPSGQLLFQANTFGSSSNGDTGASLQLFGSGRTDVRRDKLVLRGSSLPNHAAITINSSNWVGIGGFDETGEPATPFEFNGGEMRLSGASTFLSFPDGTQQRSGWGGPGSNVTSGTEANFGRITVGNSSQDGQGTASQGIVFADSLSSDSSQHWAHAAIYTTGSSGYNGNLIFATDGDGAQNVNPTEKVRITYDGNVGINTTTPSEKLEVNGNLKLTANTGAHIVFADGSQQSVAWTGTLSGGDYAEAVDVEDPHSFEPGDLLVIDTHRKGAFSKSSTPYSTLIGGVYATKPGVVGRRQAKDKPRNTEVPMAMVGIVPTKVSTENGPIEQGDLLVSSTRPGYAMKGSDRSRLTGAVIGKALGTLPSGIGTIEVLISLQ